jgi:ketosteroid isomerase-like protein
MSRITDRLPLLVTLMLVFFGVSAVAQSPSNLAARNKAIVLERFNAWQAGIGSPFDLLAESANWTIVGHSVVAKTYRGRASFLSDVIEPFNARMRERLKPSIREITADGDKVVILFDARAVARDGKPYANTYAWFFEMHDGQVTDATAFFDSIEFNDLWQRVQPEL